MFHPQLSGRSEWSTHAHHHLKGREREGQISPFHTCFLHYQGPAQTIFPLRKKISILSHWHLLEHIFVSWKDFVLLCWNVSRQETLNTWQWFWVLSYLIGLTWAELKFMLFWSFYDHLQEICWKYKKWSYTFLNTMSALLVRLWKVKVMKNLQSKPKFFSSSFSFGAVFEMYIMIGINKLI